MDSFITKITKSDFTIELTWSTQSKIWLDDFISAQNKKNNTRIQQAAGLSNFDGEVRFKDFGYKTINFLFIQVINLGDSRKF